MMWLLSLLVLVFTTTSQAAINDTTTSPTTTRIPNTVKYCIYDGTLDSRKKALDDAYLASKILDIIFIIDRSQSISHTHFNKTKTFISSLIQYQVRTGAIIIHPDYSRISLLSFGQQTIVDADGIKYGTFDACAFEDKLRSVELDQSATTNPIIALNRAKSIFETSPRKGKSTSIVWVFSDGDFRDDDNGRATAIEDLHGIEEVKVFVVGIGDWLNNAAKRENLRALATEGTNFLCLDDWQTVVDDNVTSSEAAAESRSSIYGIPISSKMDACKKCASSEKCACEVTGVVYTCVDCSGENADREEYEHICSSDDQESEWWLLYAFIGAGILGFLLLVLIVICLCLCARRRTREREQPNAPGGCIGMNGIPVLPARNKPKHPGPPLPPPPVPPRHRDQAIADPDDMYTNFNTVDTRDNGQRDRNRPDSDLYSNVGDDSSPGQTNVNAGGHRTPSGYSYVPDNEKDMPGWAAHLTTQRAENNIDHLGVFSVNNNRWAFTEGFHLPPTEIKALDSAFRVGPAHQGNQIKVAGNRYNLDKTEVSELHLHGLRPKMANGRAYQESVWVAKSGEYIIVGVAHAENDCNNVVFQLYRDLATPEQAIDAED